MKRFRIGAPPEELNTLGEISAWYAEIDAQRDAFLDQSEGD